MLVFYDSHRPDPNPRGTSERPGIHRLLPPHGSSRLDCESWQELTGLHSRVSFLGYFLAACSDGINLTGGSWHLKRAR
jgi:hypothetical protein